MGEGIEKKSMLLNLGPGWPKGHGFCGAHVGCGYTSLKPQLILYKSGGVRSKTWSGESTYVLYSGPRWFGLKSRRKNGPNSAGVERPERQSKHRRVVYGEWL